MLSENAIPSLSLNGDIHQLFSRLLGFVGGYGGRRVRGEFLFQVVVC